MSRELTYATVCSGIECMSVAARGLPLRPVFFSEIEPFPCAVLKAHYPDVPNLGDMSKIQVSSGGMHITNGRESISLDKPLDILAGGTPCFAAGTMVLTPKGYVPIETLKVGDEVVSGSGHVRKVEAVGSKMAAVGRLKVLGRPEIVCTPNHPFFCIGMKRDNRRKSETYAQMIPVGDYAVSRADEAVGKYVGRINHGRMTAYSISYPKCGEATCDDIMELAGWYLGDGYVRRFRGKTKKSVVFALCCEKKIARFKERFGGIVNVCESGEGKLIVNCTALADWLVANFGEHAAEKRIPFWCYDRENTHCLLRGYAATDGWTQGYEQKFCTVSPALAYGIADLLGNASVFRQKVPPKGMIQGREVNQRDYYQIKVAPKTIRTRYINGRYASIVRSYNGTDELVRVYNITVAEEHTYIANGLWSHNCQDVSVAGKRAGMQEGSGTRSSLAFDFVRLARELRPRWVLWENVAGSIDSKNAPDFLRFASALGDCGYSLAWRVLDAQYVRVDGMERAVPQRRRRVWVVGRLGADESVPAQILFEPDCVAGHTPPRRRAGQGFAYSLARRDRVDAGVVGEPRSCAVRTANTHANGHGVADDVTHTLDGANGQGVAYGIDARNTGLYGAGATGEEVSMTQDANQCKGGKCVVQCYDMTHADDPGRKVEGGISPTLQSRMGTGGNQVPLAVSTNSNGEDVATTLTRDLAKQTGAQQQNGGGYILTRREEGARDEPQL
jgi:site-specific DNA-cytosine methylase